MTSGSFSRFSVPRPISALSIPLNATRLRLPNLGKTSHQINVLLDSAIDPRYRSLSHAALRCAAPFLVEKLVYRSASRDIERRIDRSFRVDGSRGGRGTTPCFPRRARGPPPPVLALPISLPPSCRSTFYRHSPRSILSADNASTSLRFRGGGVALLATDRSSKDRYFRQGVNRYRESRLRSSSSNLMQHLSFRNIFLSRGSRACDRASSSLSSSSCLVLSIMYLLSLPLFPSRAPAYWNTPGVQLSRVRLCHSCSIEQVGPRRHLAGFTFTVKCRRTATTETRNALLQGSRLRALPPSVLRLSVPSAFLTDFSLFPGILAKHSETHVPPP